VRRVVSWTGNSAADRTNCAKAAAYPLGKIGREAQPVAESPAHARLEQGNGTHEATIAELRSELSQGDASRRELSDQLGTIVMKAMDLKDKLSVLQRQLVADNRTHGLITPRSLPVSTFRQPNTNKRYE
jgi:hypothetical protein